MSHLSSAQVFHELLTLAAHDRPQSCALIDRDKKFTYTELAARQDAFSRGLLGNGIEVSDRVAIYLEKTVETVVSIFGATLAGAIFVPVNPVLKAPQLQHILDDCSVRVLVTSSERYAQAKVILTENRSLKKIVLIGEVSEQIRAEDPRISGWDEFLATSGKTKYPPVIDQDVAAILYTSGSTGKPKGVVITHRNLVSGARSVATYLRNHEEDRLLAALPLSFDAGLSQITTAFIAYATVVLLDFRTPQELLLEIEKHSITGLTAVPPIWIQLSNLEWPPSANMYLRYFANTGGKMPTDVLDRLRKKCPAALPYLMYGLTEAFRSTYLDPSQVDLRPDSIGKAIPNQEVLVLRPDGTECGPNEPGELVHRGSTVTKGYWNDPQRTAERFKPLTNLAISGSMIAEIAVFSGDSVRRDEEGYLYFVGRSDDMIKTSGYRLSPTEIEEAIYSLSSDIEVCVVGVPHNVLGQAVVAIIARPPQRQEVTREFIIRGCRSILPNFMVPAHVELVDGSLPRNTNGKIDRKMLSLDFQKLFT